MILLFMLLVALTQATTSTAIPLWSAKDTLPPESFQHLIIPPMEFEFGPYPQFIPPSNTHKRICYMHPCYSSSIQLCFDSTGLLLAYVSTYIHSQSPQADDRLILHYTKEHPARSSFIYPGNSNTLFASSDTVFYHYNGNTLTSTLLPYKAMKCVSDSFWAVTISTEPNARYAIWDERTMELISDFNYDAVDYYGNGLARVWQNGKEGIINAAGREVVPCIYDSIYSYGSGKPLQFRARKEWGEPYKIISAKE